jgi:hypothetical protein
VITLRAILLMKGESNDGREQRRELPIDRDCKFPWLLSLYSEWHVSALLFACLADTMPQTVAGKSTTAKVMSESRALVKGSGRRKDNVESGKDMGEIEIFFMFGYGSLAERADEKKVEHECRR